MDAERAEIKKKLFDFPTSFEHEWHQKWIALNQINNFKIRPMEKLPPVYLCEWNTWKTLHRVKNKYNNIKQSIYIIAWKR